MFSSRYWSNLKIGLLDNLLPGRVVFTNLLSEGILPALPVIRDDGRSDRNIPATAGISSVIETVPQPRSRRARHELERAQRRGIIRRGAALLSSPRSRAERLRVAVAGHSGNHPFSKAMALSCMFFATAMFVTTSLPANAVMPAADRHGIPSRVAAVSGPTQEFVVSSSGSAPVVRDGFSVISAAQAFQGRYISVNTFTNDPFGTIQWPFALGVPITSPFGWRASPCSGCSGFHSGVDLAPGGFGAPISAIADGVVSVARNYEPDLGTEVVIDHVINGQNVQSVYGHMELGSIAVRVGQRVKVGQLVGKVGQTGVATGPHLHLEILVNGTLVDPFAWLKRNAN